MALARQAAQAGLVIFTVRLFGVEVLHVELTDDSADGPGDVPGDVVSQPVGFVQSPGDQRWETSPDLS